MKSLNTYLSEKLIINKNFKVCYDWENVKEFLFIVFNNRDASLFVDICTCEDNRTKFYKKSDGQYHLYDVKSVNSGYRSDDYKISKDGRFLYNSENDTYYKFVVIVLQPNDIEYFKNLTDFLQLDHKYKYKQILEKINIKEKELPEDSFNCTVYNASEGVPTPVKDYVNKMINGNK